MNVGRKSIGGEALTIIEVDNEVSADTIAKLSKIRESKSKICCIVILKKPKGNGEYNRCPFLMQD